MRGIGTEANSENPLAASFNKARWTARAGAESGDSDLRSTLNKEAAGNPLSLEVQTGWSGRAEIDLSESDTLSLKVRADGLAWTIAMIADRITIAVRFPQGLHHALSGVALSRLIFKPGADGRVFVLRMNASHTQNSRTASIASVVGDTITMTTAEASMFGCGAPPGQAQLECTMQPEFLDGPAARRSRSVTRPAFMLNRVIAFDISPMLKAMFDALIRQARIMVRASVVGSTTILLAFHLVASAARSSRPPGMARAIG